MATQTNNPWQVVAETPASQRPASQPPAQSQAPSTGDGQWEVTGQSPAAPVQIADSDKGVVAALGRFGTGILNLPGNVKDAFTKPPQNAREQQVADETKDQDWLARKGTPVRLAIYRLIMAPMEREEKLADAYQTIHNSLPADQREKEKDFSNTESNLHKANLHRIASIAPLIGPLAADITEHYLQGDKSGAVTELLANIGAGKVMDSASKGVARQIGKVAPKRAVIAGEETPVMAGQVKDAAPIAKEVARTPSPAIAEEQQAAAQQGIKNIATESANRTLRKFGQSTDEAASFGEAGEKVRQAAQPVFQKLDKLSDSAFSTFQNKIASATKVMRRATSMEDLEAAEGQFNDAQKSIDDLFQQHADEIGPEDLANAKAAWRDQAVLKKVHSYVESAFSAPEDIADGSSSVTRTLKGNALRPRLNQMLRKIPSGDLERVLGGKDSVRSLYEIADLVSKPEGLAEMQGMIAKIASEGHVSKLVKTPLDARNLVARYLATSPRVSHMLINALKFGTPAKIYGPLIANEISQGQEH